MTRKQFDPYAPRKRPWELAVIVVLIVLQGLAGIAVGILEIARRLIPEFSSGGTTLPTLAIALTVLIGLFLLVIAAGVWRGDRVARVVFTVVAIIDILVDLYLWDAVETNRPIRLLSVAVSILCIVIPWVGRSRLFFRRRAR